MPLTISAIRRLWAFALAGILLSGCLSTIKPGTRFYVLNPMPAGPGLISDREQERPPLSIEVAAIHLPQYLERPQIVLRSGASRLELSEFHQWGGNLRKNMMRVLAKNLSQLLATPRISITPHSPQGSPDYRVEVTVMKFERDPDGRVRLSVQWSLSGGLERRTITTRINDLESGVVETGGPDLEPTVSAMSSLLGELSRLIGRTIYEHSEGRPAI